jgi:hypothetical protein
MIRSIMADMGIIWGAISGVYGVSVMDIWTVFRDPKYNPSLIETIKSRGFIGTLMDGGLTGRSIRGIRPTPFPKQGPKGHIQGPYHDGRNTPYWPFLGTDLDPQKRCFKGVKSLPARQE